jgi:hypothetical protein
MKSERRVEEAREALDEVRRCATADDTGRKVYQTGGTVPGRSPTTGRN